MLSSMTGFGSASEEHDWGSATITISSTNARHKEISVSLPKELSHLEYAIQDIIRSFFRRGRAQVRLTVVWAPAFELARIDDEVLEKYYRHLSEVHYRLKLLEEINPDVLILDLSMPGMSGAECIKEIRYRGLPCRILVLTMYDGRTKLADQVAMDVRDHFGDKVLRTVIPRSVKVSEAPGYGMTILDYDPGSRGAMSYLDASRELAQRGESGVRK